ncbi:FAD-dependent oxidoreductase [Gloeocapsopsis dulcis]|uniref:2-polyprenyl-6-methoxyphenol hydroxylase-like oxidoreductase n=1 Tax=Gloeocapsopsis dulcis AAB1 = 1H9 TaxID=1433147 RepID=A0A6N8FT21_9CHRO|nr:FAD-dependent monooxygenase [Gloeocapsopsis dulcis]MUL36009.1 2-polyprenyl-6-methoxyphenol hydroxylase-like oxidoreductase [Gloeocapsopsis dulcis AAB1 = 1H9]WNN88262.1 FAD-dependent monooxygenase [Gloeocapsopsis dulcis]
MYPELSSNQGSHAVVIGGSIAGLVSGRVLTKHFDRVTIIERDRLPDEPIPRKGVPQSHHNHVLLMRGAMILEELFPGLHTELYAAGASQIDMAKDVAWLNPAGWSIRFTSGVMLLASSRSLLEWGVRQRLRQCPQVCFITESEVTSLLANSDKSAITGVQVRLRNQSDPKSVSDQQVYADLVVDASGRISKTPQWLTALGYEPPQETIVNSHVGYASRIYQPPANFSSDWQALYLQAAPPNVTRGGLMLPIEGNRWLVSLGGGDKDYPPTDETGFLEFVRTLRSSILYDAIKDAKPLSPIFSYRATENRRRHCEKLHRMPEGLIVTGDAACTFNPVYGQGMTIAAIAAETLDQCLKQGLSGLSKRFQTQLAQVNAVPWTLATSEDYRYRGTEGKPATQKTKLMHWYMNRVMLLSTKNIGVRSQLLQVMHMLKTPNALFHPKIVALVFKEALQSTLHQKALAPKAT